jgi:nitrogen fixation protein FixH
MMTSLACLAGCAGNGSSNSGIYRVQPEVDQPDLHPMMEITARFIRDVAGGNAADAQQYWQQNYNSNGTLYLKQMASQHGAATDVLFGMSILRVPAKKVWMSGTVTLADKKTLKFNAYADLLDGHWLLYQLDVTDPAAD